MADEWFMKKGDTLPVLDVILRDGHDAVDLTSATSATFKMVSEAGLASGASPKVSSAATIETETGRVTYAWSTGDTDTPGVYAAEIEVLYGTNTITYPNSGYYKITVLDDVTSGT